MAFHHISGQSPGAARKSNERDPAVQFLSNEPDGIHDIAKFSLRIRQRQGVNIRSRSNRTGKARALTFLKAEPQTHRIGYRQDVREKNRSIKIKPLQRLERYFTGEFRRFAKRQEVSRSCTGGTVLRKVPAGLAHDPDRGTVNILSAQRPHQAVVFQLRARGFHTARAEWISDWITSAVALGLSASRIGRPTTR